MENAVFLESSAGRRGLALISTRSGDPLLSSEHAVFGAAVVLSCLGFWLFRQANSEKAAFRRDPRTLLQRSPDPSNSGRQLLLSPGWWAGGLSSYCLSWGTRPTPGRRGIFKYPGDRVLGVSWCLYCGLPGTARPLVPYFYVVYFFVLLAHRATRGARKDGWQRYIAAPIPVRARAVLSRALLLVPSLFVPGAPI